MGASGAGKSTIFALLLRLYEIEEGQILLYGVISIFSLITIYKLII